MHAYWKRQVHPCRSTKIEKPELGYSVFKIGWICTGRFGQRMSRDSCIKNCSPDDFQIAFKLTITLELKGPFYNPNMLFLWQSSVDIIFVLNFSWFWSRVI